MSPSTRPATEDRPRSLADDLRARDDADLARLLRDRPDLRSPVPADVTTLAARATTRPSVQRALDQLDRFTLQVVDALVALPDRATPGDVHRLLDVDPGAALVTLRALALVYGPDDELTLVRTARDVVGDPAGLGPPMEQALRGYGPARVATLLADLGLAPAADPAQGARRVADRLAQPAVVEALLADADPAVRELVDAMTWGPAAGALQRADRPVQVATARTPVEWLLARGLLVALDRATAVLPREVGLACRGGRLHREPAPPDEPAPDLVLVDAAGLDRGAAGAAADVVRLVEELLDTWSKEPPRALRAGGLGVRDRARAAAALEVEPDTFALLAETAYAAGLLATGGEALEVWLPTGAFDQWRQVAVADRWHALVRAWLSTTRVAGLAGGTDGRGKVLAPLGPDLARSAAPAVRREVLGALLALPEGTATTAASLTERLRWRAPRLAGPLRENLRRWTLREGAVLGVVVGGYLSGFGRRLAGDPADGAAATTLRRLLPPPVDRVLLQADLTAVAPGPLTADLAQRLGVVADVESRGAATVYRFSDATVRRALDLGWTAAEMLDLLREHSSTPVPQPLAYLVADVARRHGRIRVGAVGAYLRSDDEAVLTEILADRRTAGLRLRRLAPTVLASPATVDLLLETLREMGLAPAAEGADGDVVVRRPRARRAAVARPGPGPPSATDGSVTPTDPVLAAAVRAIRAGERARTATIRTASVAGGGDGSVTSGAVSRFGPPPSRTLDVLALLSEAVDTGETVWIGYVDAQGRASQRLIEPVHVDGGFVEAFDRLREERRTFAVHRITGAALVDESGGAREAVMEPGPDGCVGG